MKIKGTKDDVFSDQTINHIKTEICDRSDKQFIKLLQNNKNNLMISRRIMNKIRMGNKFNQSNNRYYDFPKEWK